MFLGDDNCLGHLASAVETPTLTLFGTGNPDFSRPWGPRASSMEAPRRDLLRLDPEAVAGQLLALAARWR